MKTPRIFRFFPSVAAACLMVSGLHAEHLPFFTDDLNAARARAKEQHKDVLVDFTGSDWCGWCIRLDKEIFSKPEFETTAAPNFELVQLDFPRDPKKQAPEVTERNKGWKRELESSSFPDILILDENGRVFARTGYLEGGAPAFLAKLEALRQGRIKRDAALAKAAQAAGVEKAKLVDEAISALDDDDVVAKYYGKEIDSIMQLDQGDAAGLRTKYKAFFKRRKCEREIDRLCVGEDGAAMLANLKAYAETPDIPVESKQYALYMAAAVACERLTRDAQQGLELIEQATALAPDSKLAKEKLSASKLRLERKVKK